MSSFETYDYAREIDDARNAYRGPDVVRIGTAVVSEDDVPGEDEL